MISQNKDFLVRLHSHLVVMSVLATLLSSHLRPECLDSFLPSLFRPKDTRQEH
jgi:hypothetical protein